MTTVAVVVHQANFISGRSGRARVAIGVERGRTVLHPNTQRADTRVQIQAGTRHPKIDLDAAVVEDERSGTVVRRIVDPATPDREIGRILDHILGPIYYRLLLSGDPIDDEYLWGLIVAVPWANGEQENRDETT